jgi:uncharacterized protein (TIGR02597 family)
VGFRIITILAFLGLVFGASAQPDYPLAHWVPPSDCTKWYTSGNGHQFCVIHDMENYYEFTLSYLDDCSVNASVYYLVNSLQNGNDTQSHFENTNDVASGDITQECSESNYAWHALCWNTWMFGTEHEGVASNPCWYSENMYLASAKLQRYLCDKYGIIKDRNHIIGHNEWQNPAWKSWMADSYPQINTSCNGHTDPGVYWDWNHYMALITGAPAISAQPYSQLVTPGSNAVFTATVQGSNTMYLQWSKNGVPIRGATNSSLTIFNVQAGDAGSYSLFASNSIDVTTSRTATLTVSPAWALAFSDDFETDSSARWNFFTSSTQFTTNWAFDYSTQSYVSYGVTNAIPPAPSGSGSHGIKINLNFNGIGGSNGVSLFPKSQFYTGNYILRFDAWLNYGGDFAGGTNYAVDFATCGVNHTGNEVCWVGGTHSDGLYFMFDGEGGTANEDYRAYQGTSGAPTWLSFAASGITASGATRGHYTDPFYQTLFPSPTYETQGAAGKHWVQVELACINNNLYWQINGELIAQRTNTSSYTSGTAMIGYSHPLSLPSRAPTDNFGIFDNVRVYVQAVAPVVTFQPTNVALLPGNNAAFTVYAGGTAPFNYQWQFNGANINGATNSSYTRSNVQYADAGSYSVSISNSSGTTNSSNAILFVLTPPSFTSQPQSQTVDAGANPSFTASATGVPAPLYQWRKNGSPISGATNTIYSLNNVKGADAGSYSVVLTNSTGSATSIDAILRVNDPAIAQQPQSQTVNFGMPASFSVTAAGTAPITYQWCSNGTPVVGATGSTYSWTNVTSLDRVSYSVVISNNFGSVTSSSAVLAINPSSITLLNVASNADATIAMQWSVNAGASYSFQAKNTLLDAQWTALSNYVGTSTTLTTIDGPLTNSQRVYRLVSTREFSEPAGYYQVTLLGNSDTFVSLPFARPGLAPATITSVSGSTITVNGSPNWSTGQFVYAAAVQTNRYFIRITSGAAAGKFYTVVSNDLNTLTVDSGGDSLAIAPSDTITVEPYWTPSTAFPNGAGVFASPTPGNRFTELLLPDTTSAGLNLSAAKVLFYYGGVWKQIGDANSHNDDPLMPNSYFVVRHNVATNSTLTLFGSVTPWKHAINLRTSSTTQQDNAIGLPRPVVVSLNDSGLISSAAFIASPLPGNRTDELLVFDNSIAQKNKSASSIYYFWNGAWRRVGGGSTDFGTTQVFTPGTGVIIRKGTNVTSASWLNSANW